MKRLLMTKPLAIDLCCGLGGWTKGLQAEGFDVIGFDIERHPYPGQLVLQDIRTIHGSQFRRAAVIVASPPCQEFSRHDQPWTRQRNPPPPKLGIDLFNACFRIQREANEAAYFDGCKKCGVFHPATTLNGCIFESHDVPMVVENVRGAQKFIGSARHHLGSQYLWGDVPPLLPAGTTRKGFKWWGSEGDRTGKTAPARTKQQRSSKAVAERSEIPFELAQWIAQCFKP
jgi:C-5 cytosine-specific DNA methylase